MNSSDSLYNKSKYYNELINNFITNNKDIQLISKIQESIKIIDQTLNQFNLNEISLSFNGGKDCLVMLILFISRLYEFKDKFQLIKLNKIQCILINYEDQFPELIQFIEETCHFYNLKLIQYNNELKLGFKNYLIDYPNIKSIIIGTRLTDPFGGNLKNCQKTDNNWPYFIRIHPILTWNYQEIWDFLLKFQINYCKLYDYGYTSIGGINSTIPNPNLKIIENGDKIKYLPAYELKDGSKERDGRL
ncbi:hypothetical protein WICMUC_002425 [Wickerhamomyces mucosus]|uniref:FAD synthase n=1 Tax=Wickerhamomyces mucosus TaxID=1378264 RepID=A0A9P8PQV3_9ASCO|nr:hypothetical protein WICMUC_002425 [Wickerhamomyces mucosus]